MIKSFAKIILVSAIVLLLGQIRVNDKTIAERYFSWVKRGVHWSGNELRQSKLFASLAQTSVLSQWLNNVYPPKPDSGAVEAAEPEKEDGFNASDRESILRLLD